MNITDLRETFEKYPNPREWNLNNDEAQALINGITSGNETTKNLACQLLLDRYEFLMRAGVKQGIKWGIPEEMANVLQNNEREDILNEVLLALFKNESSRDHVPVLSTFDPQRGSFTTFLYNKVKSLASAIAQRAARETITQNSPKSEKEVLSYNTGNAEELGPCNPGDIPFDIRDPLERIPTEGLVQLNGLIEEYTKETQLKVVREFFSKLGPTEKQLFIELIVYDKAIKEVQKSLNDCGATDRNGSPYSEVNLKQIRKRLRDAMIEEFNQKYKEL